MVNPIDLAFVLVGAAIGVAVILRVIGITLCERTGHSWAYAWNHELQIECLRCSTCGRWAQ